MPAESCRALCLQFARAPEPGRVKTRMFPALSPRQACELHTELLCWTCERLSGNPRLPLEIWHSGLFPDNLRTWCRERGVISLRQQQGDDLGARMHHALSDGLARHPRVLLVGSDCPWLDAAYLERAADALDSVDVILGPALDGGYVLIGARRIHRMVFESCQWGSDGVLAQTLRNIRRLGWSARTLAPLRDVDQPCDLAHWRRLRRGG